MNKEPHILVIDSEIKKLHVSWTLRFGGFSIIDRPDIEIEFTRRREEGEDD